MTPLRVVRDRRLDRDFGQLPPSAQDEFWHVLAGIRRRPFAPGPGYTVVELRRPQRPGVRVAHFSEDRLRLLFEADGSLLVLYGVGVRPGFYRRLDRFRAGSPEKPE